MGIGTAVFDSITGFSANSIREALKDQPNARLGLAEVIDPQNSRFGFAFVSTDGDRWAVTGKGTHSEIIQEPIFRPYGCE
jgi:hypothetical protein